MISLGVLLLIFQPANIKTTGNTNPGGTRKPDNPLKVIRNPITRNLDNPLKVIRNLVPNIIWIQWSRGLTIPN